MRPAVFFDRDGTLVRLVERDGTLSSARSLDDFSILPAAGPVVRRLRGRGYVTFVVSNQPDIARGLLSWDVLQRMHERLRAEVELDDVAVCTHDDADRCACRKPQPGMLLDLARRWDVDLAASYMVGDTWRDVAAGQRAGCRTILVGGALQEGPAADGVVPDLPALLDVVEEPRHAARADP